MDRRLGRKIRRLTSTRDQRVDHGALVLQVALGARAPGISLIPGVREREIGESTNLSFLGLNLFVKLMGFILEMGKHRLENGWSVSLLIKGVFED